MRTKILFVDDDPNVLAALTRNLRKDFVFDTALGSAQGLEFLSTRGGYGLLVVDLHMPGMDGAEFLRRARLLLPYAMSIVLTGSVDEETAAAAVSDCGVFRILRKPFLREILVTTLEAALQNYESRIGVPST